MSRSHRDKDKWKIRQLVKQRSALYEYPCSTNAARLVQLTAEYAAIQKDIAGIQRRYDRGLDAYSGRKVSSRKSLALLKKIVRRTRKHRERQQLSASLASSLVGHHETPAS